MTVARIITALFLLTTTCTQPGAAQEVGAEIRAAEEALATALIEKDAQAFDRILADGFVLRGSPDVTRDAWIKNATTLCWGTRYDIADFAIVRAEESTVVASLVLTTFRDPVSCERATVRSLVTDVWIRQDGRFRLAVRHSGAVGADVAQQFSRTPAPPPRWERTAEISAVATGGNTDTQTLGAGGSVIWRPGAWETRGRTAFVRSEANDVTTAESFVAELRQSRTLSSRAQVFGRADYLANRFAGIDYRLTIDGGFSWTAAESPRTLLSLDAGLGVTHEARLAGEDQTFGASSLGLLGRWQPARTTQVENRAVLSTDIGALGNWRLQNTSSLSVAMTRVLSVKLSYDAKRIQRPVAGFERTDTIFSAALVARF